MAVNRVPVLKRCRSLDLDPTFLGYDKQERVRRSVSTVFSCARNRKRNLSTAYLRSLSETIMRRLTE